MGGGYGMGLVEMDENQNEINRFLIEGGETLGSNPLSPIIEAYTLNISVDHVFPKEHILGFFVGVGVTEPGYNFTVYFDSSQTNSGAIVPIVSNPVPSPSPTSSPTASPSPTSSPSASPSASPSPTSSDTALPSPSSPPPSNGLGTEGIGIILFASIIVVLFVFIGFIAFRFWKNR